MALRLPPFLAYSPHPRALSSPAAFLIWQVIHVMVSYLITGQPLHRAIHARVFPSSLDRTNAAGTLHWAIITTGSLAAATSVAIAIPFFSDVQVGRDRDAPRISASVTHDGGHFLI